jgi:hypothetical protein
MFARGYASSCCFVVALIYLDRFLLRRPSTKLTPGLVRRLFVVSAMLAEKYHEDVILANTGW